MRHSYVRAALVNNVFVCVCCLFCVVGTLSVLGILTGHDRVCVFGSKRKVTADGDYEGQLFVSYGA